MEKVSLGKQLLIIIGILGGIGAIISAVTDLHSHFNPVSQTELEQNIEEFKPDPALNGISLEDKKRIDTVFVLKVVTASPEIANAPNSIKKINNKRRKPIVNSVDNAQAIPEGIQDNQVYQNTQSNFNRTNPQPQRAIPIQTAPQIIVNNVNINNNSINNSGNSTSTNTSVIKRGNK